MGIGNAFCEVWRDRDRILLTQRTYNRLVQWGFQARDIPKLFRLFDHDKDGELDIREFSDMIREMGLGLTKSRVTELFDLFDDDGSGSIDAREFVKALFPNEYHDIYDRKPGHRDANWDSSQRSQGSVVSSTLFGLPESSDSYMSCDSLGKVPTAKEDEGDDEETQV